ncbi:MAG: hypothetical protein J0M12_17885 [Deltaproteobacteria bacterium]|nr:hypothetical protein [Deltaproteobacteria bacterium]
MSSPFYKYYWLQSVFLDCSDGTTAGELAYMLSVMHVTMSAESFGAVYN